MDAELESAETRLRTLSTDPDAGSSAGAGGRGEKADGVRHPESVPVSDARPPRPASGGLPPGGPAAARSIESCLIMTKAGRCVVNCEVGGGGGGGGPAARRPSSEGSTRLVVGQLCKLLVTMHAFAGGGFVSYVQIHTHGVVLVDGGSFLVALLCQAEAPTLDLPSVKLRAVQVRHPKGGAFTHLLLGSSAADGSAAAHRSGTPSARCTSRPLMRCNRPTPRSSTACCTPSQCAPAIQNARTAHKKKKTNGNQIWRPSERVAVSDTRTPPTRSGRSDSGRPRRRRLLRTSSSST